MDRRGFINAAAKAVAAVSVGQTVMDELLEPRRSYFFTRFWERDPKTFLWRETVVFDDHVVHLDYHEVILKTLEATGHLPVAFPRDAMKWHIDVHRQKISEASFTKTNYRSDMTRQGLRTGLTMEETPGVVQTASPLKSPYRMGGLGTSGEPLSDAALSTLIRSK
jgi:hypothetical protein